MAKHCYGGLGTRTCIDPPALPDIDIECKKEIQISTGADENDSMMAASSSLVCEWAQKLLSRDIPDIVELARYLVSNNYVKGQSHAAFAVLATTHTVLDTSLKDSPVAAGHSVSRPRDVNLRLQQTLQQRGQLRQQKRLLEEERSRISDTVTTHDQQTDDRHGKIGEKDRVTFHEKKEQAEKPKESRTQPVLPKLILPKPSMIASVVAASRGQSSLSATVSRPALKTGEMSPSVLLLSPPASTHPQPMLYLSPQKQNVLTSQQPIVMTPATMGQHMSSWPVNSAPLAFGPVIVSSVAQQANCVASAVTSTAGARQCFSQHQQLQQLLQQPPQLSRRQPLTTNRVLPRSDQVLPLFTTSVTTPVRTNVSSVCQHQVTVRAPVSSSAGNHSTNVAANPCLAALIRASPSRNSIRPQLRDSQCVNGPLTFKGGLHLHADLAPGGVHLHTDLAPGGSTVSGAFIEGHVSQNDAPSGTQLLTSDNLQDTAVASASISAMLSDVYGTVASPQHSVMQAESCISSLSPASNTPPQKSAAKSSSSGKVLKPPAKTVSTLLKEQRGYGPQDDQRAPYVKDKRPVSELLKESRIKRQLNTYKPRLVMLDTTQTGDGKLTSATAELIDSSNVQFGNDSLASHEPEPVNHKSHLLVNDSLRQSGWCTSSSGATSNMIQYLLTKANESHESWSSSSNDSSSVDMPAMEKDNLLSCLSLAAPDLADITPFINNNDESCNIQSMGVTTAPEGQVIPLQMASYGSKLQPQLPVRSNRDSQLSAVGHHMQLDPLAQYQMKAMYSTQSQSDMQQTMSQQQRNSAVSFSDCLAATYNNAQCDANTRRPQSESSIEQYRQQQDDLSHLALPPVTMTSRPGSDLHGSLADTSFQPGETQSFMNLPLKCGVVRSHVAVNTVDHVPNSNMSFTATHERNPSASMMLSPQSTISHGSPSSTPLSILSPKTHHRESTITGCQSFTPISGGVNFESRSFVSPVRPMATMGTVAHEHGCLRVAGDPEKAPLKQIVSSELDGSRGFLPYAATLSASGAELSQMFPWLSDNVAATVPVLPYPQEQPYGLPQTYNNDGHFAPVSSIRPVKRGRCGNNTTPAGLTKRARHHSAQSSFNVDVSNTQTEGSSRINVGAQNFATRRQLPVNSAAFSPEIQHIMDADSTLSTSQHQCQTAGAYSMHRSRSVPAHHMVHDEEDGSCEFSTTAPPDRSGSSGLDELSNEEITQLLQDKMEGLPGTARGLHVPPTQEYAARKNLTELLEGGSSQQEQQAYSSCRGDHMISGASWRPATLTCGDSAKQRFQRAMSYPGEDAALTPPSSQNPTPVDFASVVTTTDQQQSRPCSRQDGITGGRTFVVATAMHTPSSMDVSGDGREPLNDPLFSEVYDDDSSTTRGTADSVLPAGQLVTDHQPMSLEWGLV